MTKISNLFRTEAGLKDCGGNSLPVQNELVDVTGLLGKARDLEKLA